MLHIMLCLILSVGVLSAPPAHNMIESKLDLDSKITIVKDLGEARLLYPGSKFTQMERNEDTTGVFRYTLGNRVDGDHILRQAHDEKQWKAPQVTKLTVVCPPGTAVISFIEVVAHRSANLAVYVVNGGIGQRHIDFVIEIKSLWFSYKADIYGK